MSLYWIRKIETLADQGLDSEQIAEKLNTKRKYLRKYLRDYAPELNRRIPAPPRRRAGK